MLSRAENIRIATERARRDWLHYTTRQEKDILQLFNNTANEITDQISRRTAEGRIVPARLNSLLKNVKDEARILQTQVVSKVKRGMSNSIDYGMKTGIKGVDGFIPATFKTGIGSSFIDKSGKVRRYNAMEEMYSDSTWATINGNAMDFLMRYSPGGDTLSSRIWDGIHQSEKAIRNRIQMAVLSGESPARLSRDIRRYLIQPKTLRGAEKALYHPGRGVYKSAYKNAMRVTRTEMARAYSEGTFRYGNQKQWIKGYIWRVGSGNPCPICSDYDTTYFPKDMPPPQPAHANCLCYAEEVIDEGTIPELNK